MPPKKRAKKKPTPKPGRPKPSQLRSRSLAKKSQTQKSAVRFWVPSSVKASTGGGIVAKGKQKKSRTPKPKFWTPEQFGFIEKDHTVTEWDRDVNGISYSRETSEPVGLGGKHKAIVIWYGRPLSGLVVLDYPGHTKRISVHTAGIQRVEDRAGNPLPNDPYALPYPAGGWCQTCGKNQCGGIAWAMNLLESRINSFKGVGNGGEARGKNDGEGSDSS